MLISTRDIVQPGFAAVTETRVYINGDEVAVPATATILAASGLAGERIPTLCHIPGLDPSGACRMCVVEVDGRLIPSCSSLVSEGMRIFTRSSMVLQARKTLVELLLARHPFDCLSCDSNLRCELQRLAAENNVVDIPYQRTPPDGPIDFSSASLVYDPTKCVMCGRCVRTCGEIQGVHAIDFTFKGSAVSPPFRRRFSESACIHCGQCILACPTGALNDATSVAAVIDALLDSSRRTMALVSRAIDGHKALVDRVLRKIGFDRIALPGDEVEHVRNDTVEKVIQQSSDDSPMFSSACPAWTTLVDQRYPYLRSALESYSGAAFFGPGAYPRADHITDDDVFTVLIGPCTAVKHSIRNGLPHGQGIDVALTVRELYKLLARFGLTVPDEDTPLEERAEAWRQRSSDAAMFLQRAKRHFTGEEQADIKFAPVPGLEGVEAATVTGDGNQYTAARIETLSSAGNLIRSIEDHSFDFVEVMACPGGCAGGGGQPYSHWGTIPLKRSER